MAALRRSNLTLEVLRGICWFTLSSNWTNCVSSNLPGSCPICAIRQIICSTICAFSGLLIFNVLTEIFKRPKKWNSIDFIDNEDEKRLTSGAGILIHNLWQDRVFRILLLSGTFLHCFLLLSIFSTGAASLEFNQSSLSICYLRMSNLNFGQKWSTDFLRINADRKLTYCDSISVNRCCLSWSKSLSAILYVLFFKKSCWNNINSLFMNFNAQLNTFIYEKKKWRFKLTFAIAFVFTLTFSVASFDTFWCGFVGLLFDT